VLPNSLRLFFRLHILSYVFPVEIALLNTFDHQDLLLSCPFWLEEYHIKMVDDSILFREFI
jgi:hypothetical protein